jgi:hypothetical protein
MSNFHSHIAKLYSIRHDLEELVENKICGLIADPIATVDVSDENMAICIYKTTEIDEFNKKFDSLIDQFNTSIRNLERLQNARP